MLRIISGKYKSRRIKVPAGIRPTKDNIREAIFNVIAARVEGSQILDLYSGSGAFGIEALSRGASYAVFVDNAKPAINIIECNIKILDDEDRYKTKIILKEAILSLGLLRREKESFDIIFLDPPYYEGRVRKCLKNSNLHDILTNSGLIIAEHSKKDELPEKEGGLELARRLRYGDTCISIYKKLSSHCEPRRGEAIIS